MRPLLLTATCCLVALVSCDTSPLERRPTRAVQNPVSVQSPENEIVGDTGGLPVITIEGPRTKNETVRVRTIGDEARDRATGTSTAPTESPSPLPHGTIDLVPKNAPPEPRK